MGEARKSRNRAVRLASIGVLLAILLGVHLRLQDPLSSPVIPAEDPYNHMALVREHLRDGSMEGLNPGSRLYPPGMHSYVAAAWVYTGLDLADIVRFSPVAFGAIAILGVGLLLGRLDGAPAPVVGAVAMAVTPESILRTTMLAPTALDLALLPFLLLALVRLVQGRHSWWSVAATLTLFIVFSHPWLLTIIAFLGAVLFLLSLILPWHSSLGPPFTARGWAIALLIVGGGWGLALSGCDGMCGPGMAEILPQGEDYNAFAPVVAIGAAAAAWGLDRGRSRLDRYFARPAPVGPTPARMVWSAALVVGLAAATIPAARAGMPPGVDLARMFGWPVLLLSALALAAVPLWPRPAGHAAAAFAIATYPFVIFDPFHSPFWSHRTATYLGVGLVLLVGALAGILVRLVAIRILDARAEPTGRQRPYARPAAAAAAAGFLTLALAGGLVAATPEDPKGGWYRLFTPCEYEELARLARRAAQEPHALVITGDWQAKLVVAGLTTDAGRVWFKGDFFANRSQRDALTGGNAADGRSVFAVTDQYLRASQPNVNTSYFEDAPWVAFSERCPAAPGAAAPLRIYERPRGSPA